MADQIVFVQPLHDDDNGAMPLVVEPAVESVIEPFVGALPLRIRERLVRLQRIIDDDDIGTAAGQHAAGRSREPVALTGGDELLHRLTVRRQAAWKELPIPWAHHDAAAIAGELVGEILSVTDAEDLGCGVVLETPGREGDRGHLRFQMARRQVDNKPPDPAFPDRGQLGGDDFEMPVHRQAGLRVEILKAASGESRQVVPQQDLVLGPGQVLKHHCSVFENRALSCSKTFSSASVNSALSGDAGSVCRSVSHAKSSSIFIARKSAVAARLTSWVTMAWRLLTLRRPPFSATRTRLLSASSSSVVKLFAPGGRPPGLPDWPLAKRVCRGGLP